MYKILLLIGWVLFLTSCNSAQQQPADGSSTNTPEKTPADLPYTASYSSSWTNNVSDADLKMVLMTYKDWSSGNMKGLAAAMADTVDFDMYTGKRYKLSNAELMKMWTTSRDSMSSIAIDMQAWNKMYSTDKKEGHIVVWYKETDTYKTVKVYSAYYHDINQVKNGKIVWYSQYKRPALK
jgi:ketosteroid isomerase-like protein